MPSDRLRRRVAQEAARLIYLREETQYGRAKRKAAERLVVGQIPSSELPCNREIRGCVAAIERSSREEQERLVAEAAAQRAAGGAVSAAENTVDRFRTFELLLLPLEGVTQSPADHPEGDALYHSLQVFALAREALPYDEEFLLAALLHDVGKAIDRRDHVAAGLEALEGMISPRTAWLIEHHVDGLALQEGALGVRTRRRLEASGDFDELVLLAQCDRRGRAVGAGVPDIRGALDYIRELSEECESSPAAEVSFPAD